LTAQSAAHPIVLKNGWLGGEKPPKSAKNEIFKTGGPARSGFYWIYMSLGISGLSFTFE